MQRDSSLQLANDHKLHRGPVAWVVEALKVDRRAFRIFGEFAYLAAFDKGFEGFNRR